MLYLRAKSKQEKSVTILTSGIISNDKPAIVHLVVLGDFLQSVLFFWFRRHGSQRRFDKIESLYAAVGERK
jgi:hypothetical protein